MSLDGSFVCEAALQRFLARCPKLRSNTRLSALTQKGQALSADDVVAAIADPFLHPSYTIPVMGCFRPLCRNILQSAVAKLRSVPSLVSESGEVDGDVGEEDMHIVDFYVVRGNGLKLHELACLAFCRALDLAPFLLTYALNYFQFSPPPFVRLLSPERRLQCNEKIENMAACVRVSYRLLLFDSKVFSELWDWSSILDLVQYISVPTVETVEPLFDSLLDIRWCAIQILSVVMLTSDRAISNFGMGADVAFKCLLRWKDFCQDTSLEKAGWYMQEADVRNGNCLAEPVNHFPYIESFDKYLCSGDSGSQKSLRIRVSFEQRPMGGNFVLTNTVKRSFEMVLIAVSQKWPALLYGPAGSGKTALINELARRNGNRVLFIHMDEQMDSKSLIGSYICSEHPGEFKWQPGSLTQALLSGFWVVFEDIDKAPNEIQSIILPLLEGSSTFVTGHGEVISISDSFYLFGTISTSRQEIHQAAEVLRLATI